MTQINLSDVSMKRPSAGNKSRWLDMWRHNMPLSFTVLFSVVMLILTTVGLLVDTRTLLGEPIWIKPTKFAMSSIFYSATLLWLLTYIEGWPRFVRLISWVTAITMLGELILIGIQAGRGVRSHFNMATPLDAIIFSAMGTMILLLWLVSLLAVILLIRQHFTDSAWGLALKLGLVIGVIGSGLGALMTGPTAEQTADMDRTGMTTETMGAHSVGVDDGGEGLPFVGWSTEGGDLRIGHFVGMHGMQVLPLVGWFVIQQNRRFSLRRQKGLIWTAGGGYLGLVILLTWQALRGEPVVGPSGLTLSLFAGLLVAVVAAAGWLVRPEK